MSWERERAGSTADTVVEEHHVLQSKSQLEYANSLSHSKAVIGKRESHGEKTLTVELKEEDSTSEGEGFTVVHRNATNDKDDSSDGDDGDDGNVSPVRDLAIAEAPQKQDSSVDSTMAYRTKKREPGTVTKIVKCGVVGDGAVGKTTLLLSYVTQAFIAEYTPTVFDNFSAIEEVNGEVINVILWDTAGQDDYDQIRTTCYRSCKYDVVLLCFSVVHRDSFANIKNKWLLEIKQNCPGTPFILVGTKVDLREDSNINHITQKEGAKRGKEIKAHTYVECTSREPVSVGKVVMEAVGIVLDTDKTRKIKTEKQYKSELKENAKEAKKEAKRAHKQEHSKKKKKAPL